VVDDGYIEGWRYLDNVAVEIAEIGEAPQCECGELLDSRRGKSMAFLSGVCPHE